MKMKQSREYADLTDEERAIVGAPGDLVSEDAVPARARTSTVLISLRLDRDTFDELGMAAESRGQTFSTIAREALRAYVRPRAGTTRYPEAVGSMSNHKVSERIGRTWDDASLGSELSAYQAMCRAAGMREKAWRSYVDYARRFLAWRVGDYHPRDVVAGDRPVPPTSVNAAELRAQARQYAAEVEAAGRKQPTVDTYFRHAMFFIRWLEGDFVPGARLRGLR